MQPSIRATQVPLGLPKQTRGQGGLVKFLLRLGIQNLHYFDNVMLLGFDCTQRKELS